LRARNEPMTIKILQRLHVAYVRSSVLAVCALSMVLFGFPCSVGAQATLSYIYSFNRNTDGAQPDGLIQGNDGNFYGTAQVAGKYGDGTVFKMTPSGVLTVLHSFNGTDGLDPPSELTQGTDGNLYGAIALGGLFNCGTIFKITPSGAFTTLYNFQGPDGLYPTRLVLGSDGNFYGTTVGGGPYRTLFANGAGTIFKITPAGTLTTLYSFNPIISGSAGALPGELMQGADGNFYGTTEFGGAPNFQGQGTIYKFTPTGALTQLYSFHSTDGSGPGWRLAQGADGSLYGTTIGGGTWSATSSFNGDGTVFKITPSGAFTSLYSFSSPDGLAPNGVIQASDGNFYGTTVKGGATVPPYTKSGNGTLFMMTPSGTLTTLYSFSTTGADGDAPATELLQGADGNLYGTTTRGGAYGAGTIFKLSLPPPPAPGPLTAISGDHWVKLSWPATGGAGTYNLYRSTSPGAETLVNSGITKTNYTDTGLVNGKKYYYQIAAVNGIGNSPLSTEVNAAPLASLGGVRNVLALQNATNLQLSLWNVTGTSVTFTGPASATPGAGWRVAGEDDFTNTGQSQLLLQNSGTGNLYLWYMNGSTVTGGAAFSASPGPSLKVVGVGDFNGDGNPDLLLQNKATGALTEWSLNGTTVLATAPINSMPGAGWNVVGVGDFNADGHADVVFQNSATGKLFIWYMNGATVAGGALFTTIPPAGAKVVAIVSLFGHTGPDLVFQHGVNLTAWDMNKIQFVSSGALSVTVPTGYNVVAPR